MRRLLLRGVVLAVLASAWLTGAATAATGPALVGSISNATSLSGTTAVAVSGHYAYAVSYWSGKLNVIDISNPAAPAIVGSTMSLPAMTAATNVTISGHYAFVTSKNRNGTCTPGPVPNCDAGSNDDGSGNSLTIVDITIPAAPAVLSTLTDASNLFGAYAVAVSGNYAYIASQGLLAGQPTGPDTSSGSFSVINISNPAGPALVGHLENSHSGTSADALDHATSVAVSGHYAYVTAFYGQRLTVLDISNPAAPAIVTSQHNTTDFGAPDDVVVHGNHAYVVNQVASGLELSDVSIANPAAPAVVGTLSDPRLKGAYRVRMRGNFLYVSANAADAVAAVDVSNPASPRLAGSVTSDTQLANATGVDVSSTGRYVIATSPRLSSEPNVTYPPYPQSGGPTVTGTVSVIDLDPSPISVTITPSSEPPNPTSHRSANFSFSATDAVATVSCSLDNAAATTCSTPTTASYGSLAPGVHKFTVQATDATGATANASYTWTVDAAPANTSAPKVSGVAQQGRKLTASTGGWAAVPAPAYSYQWRRCNTAGGACTSIANQTGNSYKATASDVGSRLEVVVTASNSAGSAKATSAVTGVVRWSSRGLGRGTISHWQTATPSVSLSLPSAGAGIKLRKLKVALPAGLSFVKRGRVRLEDAAHKKLRFSASLRHGVLTITLKHPAAGVTVVFARGGLNISSALQQQLSSGKQKSVKLTLSLTYAGKPTRHGSVRCRSV